MQVRPAPEVSWLPQPPRRSRRRARLVLGLAVALALLVLLFAGYTFWWLQAASAFRDRTLDWIESQRAAGWHLAYGDVSRYGFPLTLGVRFDDPVVAPHDRSWQWTAGRLRLSAPLLGNRPPRLLPAATRRSSSPAAAPSAAGSAGRSRCRSTSRPLTAGCPTAGWRCATWR
ncbi:MAG: DUF2125 domain-containing protein [Rhodospirillales bacterium]